MVGSDELVLFLEGILFAGIGIGMAFVFSMVGGTVLQVSDYFVSIL